MSLESNGVSSRGVHVPAWLIGTIGVGATLVAFGVMLGRWQQTMDQRLRQVETIVMRHDSTINAREARLNAVETLAETVDWRLCRIERAHNIDPWQSCTLTTPTRGR